MKRISMLTCLIIALIWAGLPLAILAGTLASQTFIQTDKLLASDKVGYADFGSVVVLSNDGKFMAVGAHRHPVAGRNGQGKVYLFRRNDDSTWSEVQRLVASDGAANDKFGHAIAMAAAPDYTLIIGAPDDDTGFDRNLGAAYVFAYNGSSWSQQRKLPVVDARKFSYDTRGKTVAISADGGTAFVGAPGVDGAGGSTPGAVYVFSRSGSRWTQTQKIEGPIGGAAGIGRGMALSDDGKTLLVGGVYSPSGPIIGHGIVYAYKKSSGVWGEVASLIPSGGVQFDEFGTAIATNHNATTVLVGSPNNGSGRVHIFYASSDVWTEVVTLIPRPPASFYGDFGTAVALTPDGHEAAIGAWLNGSGAVHRLVGAGTAWEIIQTLTTPDDRQEHLGFAVAMTNDGQLIAGGARSAHSNRGTYDVVGAVYLFEPETIEPEPEEPAISVYLPLVIK
ncbi:MAG: hypothetical protein GY796_30315 [Chloroflexi bacterium]|nr:hypothetical protein [Chloroflexota bacterium]